ncbi:tetratricopeptide repeat protein [Ktedonospora formicarum]|uniref:Tetratricopeptide repeat protein n=2 Tax=Ktedonospora formicarum TaxID=2778364 RepID=A0A8J3I5J0_9CHLR|nr:tetratricopeptide repeat protein [Ktedonospora formicarum]
MINYNPGSFGALLYTLRKRQHLTQQQLADAVGMHRHAISRWEQGKALPVSKAIVLELIQYLRLDANDARHLLEASLTAPAPLWGVPFSRNAFFTGREETLETIKNHLHPDRAAITGSSYALYGLGGVGKTQVALEYAYRYSLAYRAVFWIESETNDQVLFSLQRMADLLQLPERSESDQQQVTKAVQHWLATHTQWLLIWDNVEDLELPQRVLPPDPQGDFLVTSRRQTLEILPYGIELQPMEVDEGILLLLRRAKVLERDATSEQIHQLIVGMPDEYTAATRLVKLVGGLPLALDQVGAYLEETGCGLVNYLHLYELQQPFLLNRRGGPGIYHPQSVTATFHLAKGQLEQTQKEALDLLYLCAFLHAESIPEELFHIGAQHLGPRLTPIVGDTVQFDLMFMTLRNLSLVHRQPQMRTLSLHRLLQDVLREQMESEEMRLWGGRVIRMVNAAFPEGIPFVNWVRCEQYLAQALACVPLIAKIGGDVPEAGELLSKVGIYLLRRGRFKEATPLLEQAVALGEHQLGDGHPTLISRLVNQAELFWRQCKYEQTELLLLRALTIGEHHLEPMHYQIGYILNSLGLLFSEQGKYEQAELFYQRALTILDQPSLERPSKPELDGLCDTLSNLGLLYWKLGKYEQAEPFYLRALQMEELLFGPEDPDTALTLNNLAALYRDQGKYEQAESLYQRVLKIEEHALGSEHPSLAFPLKGLAQLYANQGKYGQAEPLYQRALRIREQALRTDHPDVAATLDGLADIYAAQKKYTQAASLYQRALQIYEHHLGSTHLETLRIKSAYHYVFEQSKLIN